MSDERELSDGAVQNQNSDSDESAESDGDDIDSEKSFHSAVGIQSSDSGPENTAEEVELPIVTVQATPNTKSIPNLGTRVRNIWTNIREFNNDEEKQAFFIKKRHFGEYANQTFLSMVTEKHFSIATKHNVDEENVQLNCVCIQPQ